MFWLPLLRPAPVQRPGGDFRFSFEYYYAHIMRPFRAHVLDALELLEPLDIRLIAPAHGPILRHHPRDYLARYREMATRAWRWTPKPPAKKTLAVFYLSAYGNTRSMAGSHRHWRRAHCRRARVAV